MNPVNFKEQFWSFILEISQKHEINNYYIVEDRTFVNFHDEDEESQLLEFQDKRKIMYINMTLAYHEFVTYLVAKDLHFCSALFIKKYLKSIGAFLGIIKAKRVHGILHRCYILDITDLSESTLDSQFKESITNYPTSVQDLDDKDRLIISLYKVIEQQISRINMLDLELEKHKNILKKAIL